MHFACPQETKVWRQRDRKQWRATAQNLSFSRRREIVIKYSNFCLSVVKERTMLSLAWSHFGSETSSYHLRHPLPVRPVPQLYLILLYFIQEVNSSPREWLFNCSGLRTFSDLFLTIFWCWRWKNANVMNLINSSHSLDSRAWIHFVKKDIKKCHQQKFCSSLFHSRSATTPIYVPIFAWQ